MKANPFEFRRKFCLNLAFVFVGSFASTAEARRGGRVRMIGRGLAAGARTNEPTLSRDQLSACLSAENTINRFADHIDSQAKSLERLSKTVDDSERYIQQREIVLDLTDGDAVNRHNMMLLQHGQLTTQYNTSSLAINKLIDDQNRRIVEFNSNCAKRVYYESDMEALRPGK